jgi:DNA polymerase-3 subunit epsilon
MYLFFDTETTGLIQYKKPRFDACQPHLVQLAATLVNKEKIVLGQINFIVKPDGFEIPKEAADIHGITQEMAMDIGVPVKVALAGFNHLCKPATHVLAHNIEYDARIMELVYHRTNIHSRMVRIPKICTMKTLAPILKLPPTPKMIKWRPDIKFKSPNLQEAYVKIFKEEFDNAHNAMADVDACQRLFFHLLDEGLTKL